MFVLLNFFKKFDDCYAEYFLSLVEVIVVFWCVGFFVVF